MEHFAGGLGVGAERRQSIVSAPTVRYASRMSLYRVAVVIPTLDDDAYGRLAAQIRRGHADSSPILVEIDEQGRQKVLHPVDGEERPSSSRVALSMSVEAPDPLQAATTSIALVALTMDAEGLRDHYPTVADLAPVQA